jgi:DNA mismatch repair protein MutS
MTTPMMKQYLDAKRQCPGAVVLFRMGDFYELFLEDAELVSRVLGLTLTSREKGPDAIPMAGFPHRGLDVQLRRLVQAGYRVAICDQVEDPRDAKGLVQREVTRIVTPGTLIDDGLLEPRVANFLAALVVDRERAGLAWVDVSSGEFQLCDVEVAQLGDELARLEPAECLVHDDFDPSAIGSWMVRHESVALTRRPGWSFHPDQARDVLLRHFAVATLDGFGVDANALAIGAAGAIVDYLRETQKTTLEHIVRLTPYHRSNQLVIDEVTRRSLELVRTLRDKPREATLIGVLDQTATPMGARMLSQWVANPLCDLQELTGRQDAVAELIEDNLLRKDLAESLGECYDLERLTARISTRRASPRDLGALARTLAVVPRVKAKLTGRRAPLVRAIESDLDLCPELRQLLESALVDDPPLAIREGGIIREAYHADLDELREISRGGKEWIARFQADEIARSGIPSLKIGFNRGFGYYIEITNAHAAKIPPNYTRKQTLKNAERYITPELKEYEDKVLRAEERSVDMEYDLFLALREQAASHTVRLHRTARSLAALDALASLASVASRRNYCRPTLIAEPILEIRDGRHPVVEVLAAGGQFVPNDIDLDPETGRLLIVTGPNMAGKSTYIRQAALTLIMAQIGSYVPARSARVGIADRVFARIGASDELARGQSTFMVEMVETATILNTATDRSLVVLDEIGRGTSTYDGVSLAWAVAEYLHDSNRSRVLFATHYHELAELARSLDCVRNLNVAVREWEDEIIFLHKIVEGSADKSYGIHVARLAGVPRSVIERSKTILAELESQHLDAESQSRLTHPGRRKRSSLIQRSLFWGANDHVIDAVRRIDVANLTPEQALEKLLEIQSQLRQEGNREQGTGDSRSGPCPL